MIVCSKCKTTLHRDRFGEDPKRHQVSVGGTGITSHGKGSEHYCVSCKSHLVKLVSEAFAKFWEVAE